MKEKQREFRQKVSLEHVFNFMLGESPSQHVDLRDFEPVLIEKLKQGTIEPKWICF